MKRKGPSRAVRRVLPWVITGVLLLLWQSISYAIGPAGNLMLPAPTAIADALVKYREPITENALQTLLTTTIGFVLAVVAGIMLGLLIGVSTLAYSGLYPLLVAFNAVPKVALVPVFVLWCGIGAIPATLTAFSLSFFPIVVNVATGIATTEPEIQDLLRSLGATPLEMLRKVGLPRALPYLFASLKVAVTLAFVGSVISETVASNNGIGFLMLAASSRFEVPLVFAGLVVIAGMAVLAYVAFSLIEARMTHWAFRGRQN